MDSSMIDMQSKISALYTAHSQATERLDIYVDEMLKLAETSFADVIKGNTGEGVFTAAPEFVDRIESGFREMRNKLPGTLLEMAFIYRVALYDAFIPDLARVVLVSRPMLLKSKKVLTHQEIIEQGSLESLIELMAEKEVEGLTRGSLKDQRKWINDHLSVESFPQEDLYQAMLELVARRNLFVHANGIVNQSYISLVGDTPHYMGERLSIDDEYWDWTSDFLRTTEKGLMHRVLFKQS
jgi:hypothetical protein